MQTSISFLSETHQQQLRGLVRIILETVTPEKIILFGGYATGNIIEHCYLGKDKLFYEYVLDYDLLVIMSDPKINAGRIDVKIEKLKALDRQGINLIVHDRKFIKESLSEGWSFFSDIQEQGILLFDNDNLPLPTTKPLEDEKKRQINKTNFEHGMAKFSAYQLNAGLTLENHLYEKSLSNLQNAAVCLYDTMLKVQIGYLSDTNQLQKLRQQSKHLSEALWLQFNLAGSETDRRLFNLLSTTSIDSRYAFDGKTDKQDLLTLLDKLDHMEKIVRESCEASMAGQEHVTMR